jgi:hypothetical protein
MPVASGLERSEYQTWGDSDIETRTIRLSRTANTTVAQAQRTLLHEVLHAILGVTGQTARLGFEGEEDLVTALERGLCPLVELKLGLKTTNS